MYKFINKYYKINQSGFTYVEAIISIALTLVAAGAISFGIGKAVRTYKSIYLKERAIEELIKYTEEYRIMVAYGEKPLAGKQPRNGHKVILYNPAKEKTLGTDWGDRAEIVEGTLFHIITNRSGETAGEQSGYYNVKTWIEWEDQYVGDKSFRHLAFEVDQAILTKN